LQSNTEALTFPVTHLRIPPPFSALFHVNGYTGQCLVPAPCLL